MSPLAHLRTLSLRVQYALLVTLLIVVPLGGYLLLDLHTERRQFLDARVEVLQSMGHLLADEVALCIDPERLQAMLSRFGKQHPDLDLLLLDRDQRVVACTEPEWVGRTWPEEEIGRVARGELAWDWSLDEHEGLPVVEITMPVDTPACGVAALHLAEPQSTLQRQMREARWRSSGFVLALLALVVVLVILATDRLIIRRIDRMVGRLEQTGWLSASQAAPEPRDEVEALGQVLEELLAEIERTTGELRRALDEKQALVERVEGFNEELSREVEAARDEIVSMQKQLLRQERLTALGELAGALAHEVRNPLQIIRGTAEMARRHHPGAAEELQDVVEEVGRLELLVRQLLDYTRPLALRRETWTVEALLDRALAEVTVPPGVTVERDLEHGLQGHGDPTLVERVLVNLLDNAVEAVGDEGRVRVTGARREDGGLRLEVRDDGPGVAHEDLHRVFDPFFSHKEAGTGLGLALCRRIVEQHGGDISLDPAAGGGTVVRVTLPGGEP